MNLFIKRKYRTIEQINYLVALVPAYLSIIVSIVLPFLQKEDNTEIIKLQNEVNKIYSEVQVLNDIDQNILEVDTKLDLLNNNLQNDDYELKSIMIEILDKLEFIKNNI